jgi:plastocyanin
MNQTRRPMIPAVIGALAIVLSACAAEGTPSSSASEVATPSPGASEPSASAAESADASPSSSETSSGVRVRIKNQQYDPTELTVAVGTEVTFVNADSFAHTVTEGEDGIPVADPIVDEEIERGQSAKVTFDEPGTYHITCRIHSSMNITITVEG